MRPPKRDYPRSTKLGGFLFYNQLEDFEDAEDWTAASTNPLGDPSARKLTQIGPIQSIRDTAERPPNVESYSIEQEPNNPNHILGVRTHFRLMGEDVIEVKPPHDYVVPDNVRLFSVWVLGRNFRHVLYIKLRDYRGRVHKLKLGRLDFLGWRKLIVSVPDWLPQTTRFSSLDKKLHFVSFFVQSWHHEKPGKFYFYLDGFRVLADSYNLDYPGSQIKDNW